MTPRLGLALLFAGCAGLPLSAATKYVARNGSDANDGNTIASAYRTIAKGLQNIGAGGQLQIGGGVYEEALINTIPSGTGNEARTVVTNFGRETVTIRPGRGPARVLEFSRGARYITLAGNAPGQLVLDGTNVAHNVVKFSSAGQSGRGDAPSRIRLENLEIRNCPDSGVLGFPSHCEFIGLVVHHAGRTVFDHGMYIEGSDNVIEGCDIHHNFARGIQIFMSGKTGDTVFASRNTVRNCRIHDNGTGAGRLKPGLDADSGTGNLICNNLIYRNGRFGLMIQIGGSGNAAYNNTFYGNGTGAVCIKSSAGPGTDLRNNLAWENGTGVQFVDERGDTDTSHNVWDGTNPQFASVDPRGRGFIQLTARSTSALDQGTAAAPVRELVPADFWGTARPQRNAYDVGAHEYVDPAAGR